MLWFHYLRYYGYAFTDSQADKTTPSHRSQQLLSSPRTPRKKKESDIITPLISSSKMKTPQECDNLAKYDGGLKTPKKRSRGRPKKEVSELLSKSGKWRRRNELIPSSQFETDGMTSSATTSGRKRHREGSGESSKSKVKRIKTEEYEEDREEIFDVFPSDKHLFLSSDSDSADSISEAGSGSDSDQELRGIELYLRRRREAQLGTGGNMLSYFSLKYTVCLCYLGLLYVSQNVLLSDLVR